MTLAELRLALKWYETPPTNPPGVAVSQAIEEALVYGVARRVAALYEICPTCNGSGKATRVAECPDRDRLRKAWGEGVSCCVDHREIVPCVRCGGSGVVHSETGRKLSPGNALARYLFREER